MTTKLDCFHCGSDIPAESLPIFASAKDQVQVCCLGCKAVTEHIFKSGLSSYYEFRSDLASKPESLINKSQFDVYEDEAVVELVSSQNETGQRRITLSVDNIHCAACAWLIEQSLNTDTGVKSINVNTVTQRAIVSWNPERTSLKNILIRLANIGYPSQPFQICDTETQLKNQEKQYIRRLGVAGLFTMQVMMLAVAMYYGAFANMESHQTGYFKWVSMLLSVPVIFYSALPFWYGAVASLKAKQLRMDVPVALAIYGAFFASFYQLVDHGLSGHQGEVYFESISMFTFLLLIGKYLEFKAKSRAVLSNANLTSTLPLTANFWCDGVTNTVLVKDLNVGDIIVIKAGEHIAIDGHIVHGETSINESILNGEFEPVSKSIGDTVLAGSINNDGTIRVKVTAVGEQTTLSHIGNMQAEFAQHKPKFSVFADKIAHWFVFSQLVLAAITYIIWLFVSPEDALWVSLSVLVATCPCALSLATPTAYTCIMSALNKQGILIKDASAFDKIISLDEIAFDKTGTLTRGEFAIVKLQKLRGCTDELLQAAVRLQTISEHPIARAFNNNKHLPPLSDKRSTSLLEEQVHIGQGVSAMYRSKRLKIGSAKFCAVENQNEFNVFITYADKLVAKLSITDSIKSDAKETISRIQSSGLECSMLTGDSSDQVEAVSAQLNLSNYKKSCTPEQKAKYIQERQMSGKSIMMIGDGINDAPVFAASDVSIAMGSGSDISKFTADIIILKNNLDAVLKLVIASKQTIKTIKNNLYWSLVYNAVILPVAMLGYVAPYVAVIGMSASSIWVVTNSLKLLKIKNS